MKFFKNLFVTAGLSMALMMLASPAQATLKRVLSLNDTVKVGGTPSVWIDGTVVATEQKTNPKGWPYVVVTYEINDVLKKSDMKHPDYGEWIYSEGDKKFIKVHIFGALNRSVIKGLVIPKEGEQMIVGLYGPSQQSGFSSIIPGSHFLVGQDGKVKNEFGNRNLKLGSIEAADELGRRNLKALQAQVSEGAGLDRAVLGQVIKDLVKKNFPNQ